jgi:DnaJ-class molecular chaperone
MGAGEPSARRQAHYRRAHRVEFQTAKWENTMQRNTGKKKEKCKNCEGKGLIKNGDKKMKCQRCGGTGFKP